MTRLIVRWRRMGASKRPLLLVIAGSAFLIGAWISVRSLGSQLFEVDWVLIAVVAVLGVPAAILLNALEFREMGRFRNVDIPISEAARIAVLSTAANMMPFPGGVLVRSSDLIARGVTTRDSIKLNVLAGIYSIGIAGLIVLALFLEDTLGTTVGAAMIIVSVVTVGAISRDLRTPAVHVRLAIVEAVIVVVTAGRGWLIIVALGVGGDWSVALGIASVYPVAALIGIFPGGLALREALAGLVTKSMVGGASIGFLVAAVDRMIGLIVHAPIALFLAKSRSPSPGAEGSS